MTKNISDEWTAVATLDSLAEQIAFVLILAHFIFSLYLFCKVLIGRALEFKTATARFSIVTLTFFLVWQVLNFLALYVDCPKLVSLIAAILAAWIVLLNSLGLASLLEHFTYGSKIITPSRVKLLMGTFVVLHFVLVGPHYYLFMYYDQTNPSWVPVKTYQLMYQAYIFIIFFYVTWQFFYMAIFMQNFFKLLMKNRYKPNQDDSKVSMSKAFAITVTALVIVFISIIAWVYSFTVKGLTGQLLFRVASAYVGAYNSFAVLLFIELKAVSRKVSATMSTGMSVDHFEDPRRKYT